MTVENSVTAKRFITNGVVYHRQMREVIAYKEDLHVWIYYDQSDDILRYEAYVVDYDDKGEPTTLAFVVDDGILPWSGPIANFFATHNLRSQAPRDSLWAIPRHTRATLLMPKANLYLQMSEEQTATLHSLFAREEAKLKARYRSVWTKRLQALGYDVIPSAY